MMCRGADRFSPNADQKTPWGIAFNSGSPALHSAFADAAGFVGGHA